MKEIIVLGLKDESNGDLFVYETESSYQKQMTFVEKGKEIVVPTLDPFPFSHFSSLDLEKDIFNKYSPCYLKVLADISDKEFDSMRSGGIVYHRFPNRKLSLISEFEEPFKYTIEMMDKFKDNLGYYFVHTWLVQTKTYSDKEHNCMKELLLGSFKGYQGTRYNINVHLNKHSLDYINYCDTLSEKYNVVFKVDFNYYDKEMIKHLDFKQEHFETMVKRGYSSSWYSLNSRVNQELLDSISDSTIFSFLQYLSFEELTLLEDRGVDLNKLINKAIKYNFEKNINHLPSFYNQETHEKYTIDEILSDNYKPFTYEDYDYDIDGYPEKVFKTENYRLELFDWLLINNEFIQFVDSLDLNIFKRFKKEWLKKHHYYKTLYRLIG